MPPHHPLVPGDPRRLGRFRLLGRLGEGGQGVVYLGQGPAGEHVAVKVLKHTDPRARDRLSREMAAAMRVAEFLTARVIDAAVDGPLPYIVSEYVDGPSLQERVEERGPLRNGELNRLMLNTARALRAIHRVGIVHRDLKPANILLGPDGPRVVDFGIARAIDAEIPTQLVGTPAYFAPEWLQDQPPTPASDVFAWAGTMVFAATGRPAFGLGSPHALLNRVAHDAPDLSGVPGRLRPLLERCLSKDPNDRPTAAEVDEQLLDLQINAPGDRAAGPEPVGHGAGGSRYAQTRREPIPEPAPTRGEPMRVAETASGPLPAAPETGAGDAAPETAASGPAAVPRPRPEPPVPSHGPATGPIEPARGGGRRIVFVLGALVVAAVIAVVLVTKLSGGGEPETVIPADYAGTWTGTVTQTEGISGRTVQATMTMRQGERTAVLTFSPVPCDGRLTLEEADTTELRFELTGGQCPASAVQVHTEQGRLELHASGAGSYTANGVLARSIE